MLNKLSLTHIQDVRFLLRTNGSESYPLFQVILNTRAPTMTEEDLEDIPVIYLDVEDAEDATTCKIMYAQDDQAPAKFLEIDLSEAQSSFFRQVFICSNTVWVLQLTDPNTSFNVALEISNTTKAIQKMFRIGIRSPEACLQ